MTTAAPGVTTRFILPTTAVVTTPTGPMPTTCAPGQFQCGNGNCVDASTTPGGNNQLCDGVNDCGDYSDEIQCGKCVQSRLTNT